MFNYLKEVRQRVPKDAVPYQVFGQAGLGLSLLIQHNPHIRHPQIPVHRHIGGISQFHPDGLAGFQRNGGQRFSVQQLGYPGVHPNLDFLPETIEAFNQQGILPLPE